MAPVANIQAARLAQLRAAIVVKPRGFGKSAQHVQLGECRRSLLKFAQPFEHGLAHALEQVVFQLHPALFSAQNPPLHLLEVWRDKPLTIGDGLLADIVRRHLVQVGFGDLKVVAEDRVEPHFEGRDTRAHNLVLLQLRDPILALAHGRAQFIQRGVEAIANQAAFLYSQRRLIHNGSCYQLRQIRRLRHLTAKVLQQKRMASHMNLAFR